VVRKVCKAVGVMEGGEAERLRKDGLGDKLSIESSVRGKEKVNKRFKNKAWRRVLKNEENKKNKAGSKTNGRVMSRLLKWGGWKNQKRSAITWCGKEKEG